MAYDRLSPIGEVRADLLAGLIAATIAEVNRDPEKRSEPFGPRDFLLFVEALPPDEEADVEKIVNLFKATFPTKDLRH